MHFVGLLLLKNMQLRNNCFNQGTRSLTKWFLRIFGERPVYMGFCLWVAQTPGLKTPFNSVDCL